LWAVGPVPRAEVVGNDAFGLLVEVVEVHTMEFMHVVATEDLARLLATLKGRAIEVRVKVVRAPADDLEPGQAAGVPSSYN
jgi:hypothetical protein